MALDPGVLVLVLLAALGHASWNALAKAGGDQLVFMTYQICLPVVPAFILALLLPPMAASAWPYLIVSAVVHNVYFALLIGAYRHGDLSQVYPISRGSAPALVALGAWALAGEALSAAELLGVFIVSGGIISLAWRRGLRHDGETKAVVFALLNGFAIATYTIADGLGVRESGAAFTYIAWLFALDGFPLAAMAWWQRRGRLKAAFAAQLKPGIAGAVIASGAYAIVIWALSLGPMAHIVALRETSVLLAAAIGALVLGEPFGRYRIVAAAVVAAGAIVLQIG
jgi:drug/metabolite transporter (DMT)-like permease